MEDLSIQFENIFKHKLESYIEQKKLEENVGHLEVVPIAVSKEEIRMVCVASLATMFATLQCDELFVFNEIVLKDEIEQAAYSILRKIITIVEKYLREEKLIEICDC